MTLLHVIGHRLVWTSVNMDFKNALINMLNGDAIISTENMCKYKMIDKNTICYKNFNETEWIELPLADALCNSDIINTIYILEKDMVSFKDIISLIDCDKSIHASRIIWDGNNSNIGYIYLQTKDEELYYYRYYYMCREDIYKTTSYTSYTYEVYHPTIEDLTSNDWYIC